MSASAQEGRGIAALPAPRDAAQWCRRGSANRGRESVAMVDPLDGSFAVTGAGALLQHLAEGDFRSVFLGLRLPCGNPTLPESTAVAADHPPPRDLLAVSCMRPCQRPAVRDPIPGL